MQKNHTVADGARVESLLSLKIFNSFVNIYMYIYWNVWKTFDVI